MFGIGWSEFILIALVLLVFVGPKHLPSVLKKFGLVVGEIKRAGRELQTQVTEEIRDIEQNVGDIRSSETMFKNIIDEISDDIKDPYSEAYHSKKEDKEDSGPSPTKKRTNRE